MCQYQYYYEGCRSFGDNIPCFCQGAYFPGDEPGEYCELTGQACQDPDGEFPEDCELKEDTDRACPDCNTVLKRTGHGILICPECGYKE